MGEAAELDLPAFWQEDISEESIEQPVTIVILDIGTNSANENSAINNR